MCTHIGTYIHKYISCMVLVYECTSIGMDILYSVFV